MANIKINNKLEVKGRLSIVRGIDKAGATPEIVVSGQLATHKYFEEIFQIETDRFLLKGVEIIQESVGSEDFDIFYSFVAKSLEFKGDMSPLTDKEILEIESSRYDSEGGVKRE
jgi:hypothetical protein